MTAHLPRYRATYPNGVRILFHNPIEPIAARMPDGRLVGWTDRDEFIAWAKANLPAVPRAVGYIAPEFGPCERSPRWDFDLNTDAGRAAAIEMRTAFLEGRD